MTELAKVMESRPGANGEAEDHSNQRQRSSWRREQWVFYILALMLLSVFIVATGLVVFPLLIAGYVTLVFVYERKRGPAKRWSTTELGGVTITTPLPLRRFVFLIVGAFLFFLLLLRLMSWIAERSH